MRTLLTFLIEHSRTIELMAVIVVAASIIAGTAYLSGRTIADMDLRDDPVVYSQVSEDGRTQRELLDLAAQNAMAHWTTVMAWAAVLSLGITGFGVIAVWQTLKETRKAVEATSAGTMAMRQAAATSEQIGIAQTRAYLSVTHVSYEASLLQAGVIGFQIEIENAGQSPALNVSIKAQIEVTFDLRDKPTSAEPDDTIVIGGEGTSFVRSSISARSRGSKGLSIGLWEMGYPPSPRPQLHEIVMNGQCYWTDAFGEELHFDFSAFRYGTSLLPFEGDLELSFFSEMVIPPRTND